MREAATYVYSSSIEDFNDVNSSFSRGSMRIAYHGQNRNGSYISKEAFAESVKTIYNRPIVCNYSCETDSIGGHDVDFIKTDSTVKMINITEPVGVVPESANTWWEHVTEADGTDHEYLCCDILLWKRQQAYQHLIDNKITDESMEITILQRHYDDDGRMHIDKFEFTAFCLLERDRPCFESAGITAFSFDEFKAQFAEMMEELHNNFSTVTTADAADIDNKILSKGGKAKMNLDELMAKYGLTSEDIDFDADGMSAEDIEARFAAIADAKKIDDHSQEDADKPESPVEPEVPAEPEEQFALTNEQFREEIFAALSTVQIEDPYCGGTMNRFWYLDCDTDLCIVYVTDATDYRLYGMNYTMDGDSVVIDFASCKRKKVKFADFEEGSDMDVTFSFVRDMCSDFHQKYCDLNKACEELRAFKDQTESERMTDARNRVFDGFADLSGNEMFEELRTNCGDMTPDQIEEKCFAIRGRMVNQKFSVDRTTDPVRLPVEDVQPDDDEPYGGIFRKYGIGE